MIPFAVVVGDECRERLSPVGLTEEYQAIEAFLCNRSNEALRMRIAVRRAVRRLQHADSNVRQRLAKRGAPLIGIGQGASGLADEGVVWMGCRTDEMDSSRLQFDDEQRVVTRPWTVHTSVVKKSAAAIASQCAAKNVRHESDRSGTGLMPWARRIVATVDRAT